MSCYYHKDSEAISTCCNCGKFICDPCMVEIDERVYCKPCVGEIMKKNTRHSSQRPRHNYSANSGEYSNNYEFRSTYDTHEPAGHTHNHGPSHPNSYAHGKNFPPPPPYTRRPRRYSGFITFLASLIPGMGHVYLGLIKRGMFFLSSLFLSCYLLTIFHSVAFAFMVALIALISFFDAFRIRNLLNSGTKVEDDFEDILGFIKKYYIYILIIFALELFRNIFEPLFRWNIYGERYYNSFFGIIVIIFGIYVIRNFRLKKRQEQKNNSADSSNSQEDYIDRR